MRKIPTMFRRDEDAPRYVVNVAHPDCTWVFFGEGVATRKYDGTCVMYDGEHWWARREVKPGKTMPANYVPVETDDVTGKTVGWEPIEQSSFAKFHAEALTNSTSGRPGTYELLGPKINGDPEGYAAHILIRHGWALLSIREEFATAPRDYEGLRDWLHARPYEGIVWHHPDGRMAKIKRRDFPAVV